MVGHRPVIALQAYCLPRSVSLVFYPIQFSTMGLILRLLVLRRRSSGLQYPVKDMCAPSLNADPGTYHGYKSVDRGVCLEPGSKGIVFTITPFHLIKDVFAPLQLLNHGYKSRIVGWVEGNAIYKCFNRHSI